MIHVICGFRESHNATGFHNLMIVTAASGCPYSEAADERFLQTFLEIKQGLEFMSPKFFSERHIVWLPN